MMIAPTPRSHSDATGERRHTRPKTVGYYAAFIALGLVSASLGPTLPGLAKSTGSQLSQIGLLFAARSLGYLAGSLLGGRLYDRIIGHPVMGGSLLVMAAMMGAAPLLTQLGWLAGAIFALGMAEGALDVGGNTLLVWVHQERVGPFMNGLHFFFGVGAFLSPLLVAWAMPENGGIGRAYWTLALLQLPPAVWLLSLPSPSGHRTTAAGSSERLNGRVVALIVLFFCLYTGAEVAFGGWIYSYAVALQLGSHADAAYLTSAFWGALTVGRLLAVPVALRLPSKTVLLVDCVGGLVSLVILLLGSQSLTATFVGTCSVGLFMASIFPAALSLAQGRMRITGRVTGWFFVGASGGGMTLPWLIGQFFDAVGPLATMVILFIDMAAAMTVLAVLTFQSARPVYHWLTGER